MAKPYLLDGFDNFNTKLSQKIFYFNNISDMKTSSILKDGDYVSTKGYYTPNDFGGGKYAIMVNSENLSDNGGTILILNSGLLAKLIYEDQLNICQFGAKHSNSNFNNDVCIQSAIDSVDPGTKLLIPPKTFYFYSGITITKPISLIGTNSSYHDETLKSVLRFIDNVSNKTLITANYNIRCSISDLIVHGGNSITLTNSNEINSHGGNSVFDLTINNPNVNGLYIYGYSALVENVNAYNFSGIALNFRYYNFVTRCNVFRSNIAFSPYIDNSMIGCRATYCNYGIYEGTTAGSSTNSITDFRVDLIKYNGIYVEGFIGWSIDNYMSDNVGESSIRINNAYGGRITGRATRCGNYYRGYTKTDLASLSFDERSKAYAVSFTGSINGIELDINIYPSNGEDYTGSNFYGFPYGFLSSKATIYNASLKLSGTVFIDSSSAYLGQLETTYQMSTNFERLAQFDSSKAANLRIDYNGTIYSINKPSSNTDTLQYISINGLFLNRSLSTTGGASVGSRLVSNGHVYILTDPMNNTWYQITN